MPGSRPARVGSSDCVWSTEAATVCWTSPARATATSEKNVFVRSWIVLVAVFAAQAAAQWQELQQLAPGELGQADYFGLSVAFDGDLALIGAETDDMGTASGSVFVYRRLDGMWEQEAKLFPSDGRSYDYFGYGIDVDHNTVVSGATERAGPGRAVVFEYSGEDWVHTQTIPAPDPEGNGTFGWSVAVEGDWMVVSDTTVRYDGAEEVGAAYMFRRDGGAWALATTLAPETGTGDDLFGTDVEISGDAVAISSMTETSVSVSVFRYVNGDWQREARLVPSADVLSDGYTPSVSIDGETVVVGANGAGQTAGAAVVFQRKEGAWFEVARLESPDAQPGDHFGESVSLDGDRLAVGCPRGTGGTQQQTGAVHLYRRDGTGWMYNATLRASDGAQGDEFGEAVSVRGGTLFTGAWKADRNGAGQTGAAYVFSERCIADWDANGTSDSRDILAFLSDWAGGDPAADLDHNDTVDTRDVILFLNAWVAGC